MSWLEIGLTELLPVYFILSAELSQYIGSIKICLYTHQLAIFPLADFTDR